MAQAIDWGTKERYARSLSDSQLVFAREDCRLAAIAVGEVAQGKDAGYYRDEASIYVSELMKRTIREAR